MCCYPLNGQLIEMMPAEEFYYGRLDRIDVYYCYCEQGENGKQAIACGFYSRGRHFLCFYFFEVIYSLFFAFAFISDREIKKTCAFSIAFISL
jgi:hypothetical protein